MTLKDPTNPVNLQHRIPREKFALLIFPVLVAEITEVGQNAPHGMVQRRNTWAAAFGQVENVVWSVNYQQNFFIVRCMEHVEM